MNQTIESISEDCTIHRLELPTPLPVGPVNAYLIVSGNQRVLVDCGPKWPETKTALVQGLRSHGLEPSGLTALVLTHGHVDHVGFTRMFQDAGVPVFAHPGVRTWLQPQGPWDNYRAAFFKRLYHEMGVPEPLAAEALHTLFLLGRWNDRSVVDQTLEDGSSLPGLPQFRVVYVPGHAQAAIALWNVKTGDLICGDQVLPHISSNAFVEPDLSAPTGVEAKRTLSLLDYRENLSSLLARPLSVIYPGHGQPFDDAYSLIRLRLGEQEVRRDEFHRLLQTMPDCSAWELACAYFSRHRNQVSLILSEAIGYLDWLRVSRSAEAASDKNGVIRWRVV